MNVVGENFNHFTFFHYDHSNHKNIDRWYTPFSRLRHRPTHTNTTGRDLLLSILDCSRVSLVLEHVVDI